MNKKTTFLGAVAGLSGLLPISAHAALPGAELSLCWAIPFAGILLSIAFCTFLAQKLRQSRLDVGSFGSRSALYVLWNTDFYRSTRTRSDR